MLSIGAWYLLVSTVFGMVSSLYLFHNFYAGLGLTDSSAQHDDIIRSIRKHMRIVHAIVL